MPPEKFISPAPANPQTATEYMNRAWIMQAQGDQTAAESDFRQSLKLDAQSVDGYYGLGLALKSLGRASEARQAFEIALELVNSNQINSDVGRVTILRHLIRSNLKMLANGA